MNSKFLVKKWKIKGQFIVLKRCNLIHWLLHLYLRLLSHISVGVVCPPIHAETGREAGGGRAKVPYPSNLFFKHPIKLKLGMDDHHNNWNWVTDFCCDLWLHFLLTSAKFYILGANCHMSKTLVLIVQSQ